MPRAAAALLAVASPTASVDFKYLGCYQDAKDDRLLDGLNEEGPDHGWPKLESNWQPGTCMYHPRWGFVDDRVKNHNGLKCIEFCATRSHYNRLTESQVGGYKYAGITQKGDPSVCPPKQVCGVPATSNRCFCADRAADRARRLDGAGYCTRDCGDAGAAPSLRKCGNGNLDNQLSVYEITSAPPDPRPWAWTACEPWAPAPPTTVTPPPAAMYLRPGSLTRLLTCGATELFGRVMDDGAPDPAAEAGPGDARQQWFEMFFVRVARKEAVTVKLGDVDKLLPLTDPDAPAAAPPPPPPPAPVGAAAAGAGQLTTLRVAVGGVALQVPGSATAAGGAVNITVTQDVARRIGVGYVETVDVTADGIGMQFQSSAANGFASEVDRVRKTHMDLRLTSINATGCKGLLPELWGVKAMSRQAARFLRGRR